MGQDIYMFHEFSHTIMNSVIQSNRKVLNTFALMSTSSPYEMIGAISQCKHNNTLIYNRLHDDSVYYQLVVPAVAFDIETPKNPASQHPYPRLYHEYAKSITLVVNMV